MLKSADQNPETDPLDYWAKNATMFPLLSALSRNVLCVCATSCASERFFSVAGHLVSKKRASLKPEMINTMSFLAYNMRKMNLK